MHNMYAHADLIVRNFVDEDSVLHQQVMARVEKIEEGWVVRFYDRNDDHYLHAGDVVEFNDRGERYVLTLGDSDFTFRPTRDDDQPTVQVTVGW